MEGPISTGITAGSLDVSLAEALSCVRVAYVCCDPSLVTATWETLREPVESCSAPVTLAPPDPGLTYALSGVAVTVSPCVGPDSAGGAVTALTAH